MEPNRCFNVMVVERAGGGIALPVIAQLYHLIKQNIEDMSGIQQNKFDGFVTNDGTHPQPQIQR